MIINKGVAHCTITVAASIAVSSLVVLIRGSINGDGGYVVMFGLAGFFGLMNLLVEVDFK